MRYVVYGAGAVGGVIAARLALGGHDVQVVARGAHLEAIQRRGLRLVTAHDEAVVELRAADTVADLDVGSDTAVLVSVKSHQTAAIMHDVLRGTPPDVTLVSAQNGVANEATMLRGRHHVLGMVVMLPSSHLEPGVVIQGSSAKPGLLDLGCFPSGTDDRAEAVADGLRAGGFESVVRPDIMAWKYRKLMLNLGNAAQAACAPGADKDELDELVRSEGEAVLAAADIAMVSEATDARRRADHLDTSLMRARGGGSTWQSLRRGTGDVEVDYLNGEISLLGRLHGVPTPANDLLRDTVWRLAAERAEPGSVAAADLLKELQT
ncbi:ketopantoate reductase family protein [Nocardioides agariphilus]|uniref:Ketopantoate reductase family protein n=1 Tax=Nocardioides agariphilus TaxID=433664 RepID=A0A930YI33_9ACTN|nr:2-dehydropantoate 2-reductase N-terminal domain-containing protein [Nocardioides agariphilus]MBF4767668.1 ketopantoate reductase family protein [Nocardioides agariphilus]